MVEARELELCGERHHASVLVGLPAAETHQEGYPSRPMLRWLTALLCAGCAFGAFAGAASAAKLAYETGSATTNVWLANADGSGGTKLGPGQQPLISPNGKSVAATLFGPKGPGLVIYTPGAATKKYFDNAKATAGALAWSPDSRFLAVGLTSNQTSGKGSSFAVVDTSGGTVTTISKGSVCGASFAPTGADRLAYAASSGATECFTGHVNVFTVAADGSNKKQITSDGRSLNPVWGPKSIVFDQVTPRKNNAPAYQLFTMRPDGSHRVQITHMKIPNLVDGLVPIQLSADGKRLLAQYVGQDTSQTWAVTMSTRKAKQLTISGQSVVAGAISKGGKSILVAFGAIDAAPKHGMVETLPFGGGKATVLVKHAAQPTWNK